jgi:recombination associated protein RdgC
MWFKNIRVFQFQDPIKYQPEQIAQQLEEITFQPCPKSLPFSMGFVAPSGNELGPLVHGSNGFMMIRLRIEEKVLPPAVVREKLQDKIKEIEEARGRKVYKDEKERLKDEIYENLLSKAFTKSSYVNAVIDTEKNYLIIDSASGKKQAQFISLLNRCIANPVFAPKLQSVPQILTQWVRHNDHPSSFYINNACVLKDITEEGGVIRLKKQDLGSDAIQWFLKDGYLATQALLEWSEQISFTLKEDFSISGVRFLEAVKDLAKDGMSESPEQRFSTNFMIMSETLRQFLNDLLPCFAEEPDEENKTEENEAEVSDAVATAA